MTNNEIPERDRSPYVYPEGRLFTDEGMPIVTPTTRKIMPEVYSGAPNQRGSCRAEDHLGDRLTSENPNLLPTASDVLDQTRGRPTQLLFDAGFRSGVEHANVVLARAMQDNAQEALNRVSDGGVLGSIEKVIDALRLRLGNEGAAPYIAALQPKADDSRNWDYKIETTNLRADLHFAHENERLQGAALRELEEERARLEALLGLVDYSKHVDVDDFVDEAGKGYHRHKHRVDIVALQERLGKYASLPHGRTLLDPILGEPKDAFEKSPAEQYLAEAVGYKLRTDPMHVFNGENPKEALEREGTGC